MNKPFKLVFILAAFTILGIANAQEAAAPVVQPAVPEAAPVPAAAPVAPVAPAPAPADPVPAPAPVAAPAAPAAPAPAPAPEAAPVAAQPDSVVAPVAEAQAVPQATDSVAILVVKEPKKKRRATKELTIVDVPANFEIQARKVMPIDSDWGNDNLDTWWGRANLMVLTESENFVGKIHLRMYPDGYKGAPSANGSDYFQLYEAWAWHRSDYVNVKLGRWDNTTRFGSKNFGGYIDAKKDKNSNGDNPDRNRRQAGFMSTYDPENAVQFGLNNFSENISLDIALISSDNKLNKGDLRIYFQFKELAGLENMDIGVGYRSNVFDEIYSKYGDVTHNVDLAVRMLITENIGILKDLSLFAEAALIGLDDQAGEGCSYDKISKDCRGDRTGLEGGSKYNPAFPILAGLDFSLYRGLDKIVIEAEFDNHRNKLGEDGKPIIKDGNTSKGKSWLGSIYVQKKLNDRFTLNLGVQSENNTKDFSLAGRLQGRIN